jgi:coproporphyrinogen III oxidase
LPSSTVSSSAECTIDRALLVSWRARVPAPIDELVDALLAALPPGDAAVQVADDTKRRLAAAVRAFYRAHPAAIGLQARGDVRRDRTAARRLPTP